uniref:hypothetical protein n=1 Tax=Edaphosphingomonas laterariae TaxID=861865 RepID=UPI0011818757|nr:hypothetical protein [Sphingomonas laterariae]
MTPRPIDYRALASRAACEALATRHEETRRRCTTSAAAWARIADAVEAGDTGKVARLINNLAFL